MYELTCKAIHNINTFMREVAITSSALSLRADKPLTPAMLSVVWEIAGALDAARVPASTTDAVWLSIPSIDLRGEKDRGPDKKGRSDNFWLRQCLDRLTGVKITGEHKGDPWGAVLVAEWRLDHGGSTTRILIPPTAVHVLRSPSNFDKIESRALHGLSGHGRKLYVLLSGKKKLAQKHWSFSLGELRDLMGVADRKSYQKWPEFRRAVLLPALEAIADYGTVKIKMTPRKEGRVVTGVRFDWEWKDPMEATETVTENERHSSARRKQQDAADAPPMIEDEEQADPALTWWGTLTDDERAAWGEKVGLVLDLEGPGGQKLTQVRRESAVAKDAFALHQEASES